MVLPGLAQRFGPQALFVALAAFSVATLAMLPFLAEYPERERAARTPARATSGSVRAALAMTLAGVFLFQASNMALNAFLIPLGRDAGLTDGYVNATLRAASWVGALGAIAVIALAGRGGRRTPLLAVLLASVLGTFAFVASANAVVFAAANALTAVAWSFVVPFLFGMCADFDGAGRTATVAGFFSKMGLASGPAIGALLVGDSSYPVLVAASAGGLLACAVLVLRPARLLDERRRSSAA